METGVQCAVRPCGAPACRRVVFLLPADAGHPYSAKFSAVAHLCVNHYALTAVARDLLELLDTTVVELDTTVHQNPTG